MAKVVQHRRGTGSEIATRVGAPGELWVNTSDSSVHVQDGTIPGGTKLVTTPQFESRIEVLTTVVTPQMTGPVHGDGVGDDTVPVQAALNARGKVFLPPGRYAVKSQLLQSGTEFFGAGDESVLVRYDGSLGGEGAPLSSQYILAINPYSMGTPNPADNSRNIRVRDMKLDGRRRDFGRAEWAHSMVVSAASEVDIQRVHFFDWRGDGLYLGSGTTGGIERHNQRVNVLDCIFDGLAYAHRNGISIIDVDGCLIARNLFKRIGNTSLSTSVGAIDFEPDSVIYAIYRNVAILENQFEDIPNANTSGITFFNSRQNGDNFGNVLIGKNKFLRCNRAIWASAVRKDLSSPIDSIDVIGNEFVNSFLEDINLGGMKRVRIRDNILRLDPEQNGTYRGGISVGGHVAGVTRNAIDWVVEGNTLIGLRPQFGAIAVYGARGVDIRRNRLVNISGRPIALVAKETANNGRYLEDLRIIDNEEEGSSVPLYSDASASPEVDRLIRTLFEGNISKTRSILVNGAPQPMPGMTVSSAPSAGTFNVGDKFPRAAPTIEQMYHVCSVGGTTGTLAGVTGDATNGSNVLTNVAGTDFERLREGQYVTVVGSVTVHRITKIDGATVTLSGNYTGTTGTGKALSWSPFAFAEPLVPEALLGDGEPVVEGGPESDPL